MKKNNVIGFILVVTMVFTVFIGTSLISQANYTIGNEIITQKDLSFDSLAVGSPIPVDSPTPAFWGFGSAFTTGIITAGGADGTANYLDISEKWQVLGIQERVGYLEAGKSYRLSAWMKGFKPYQWKIVVWNGTADQNFDARAKMLQPLSEEWQKYNFDFKAPEGAGAESAGPNGHFFILLQSADFPVQVDNISVKEIFVEPTPTPDPNATPTPTPAPLATPAIPKIFTVNTMSDIVSGSAQSEGNITLKVGTKTYTVPVIFKMWNVFIIDPVPAGTKITAINTLNKVSSAVVTTYVLPTMPTIMKLKANSIYVKGKAIKYSVVYAKIGAKTYSSKATSKGSYNIKIPKIKKGTTVSVRCKLGGQFSAYRKTKAV